MEGLHRLDVSGPQSQAHSNNISRSGACTINALLK